MNFNKLTKSGMSMDVNNEKVANLSVIQKGSNHQNLNLNTSNHKLNYSTMSMREKLKTPKKINDTEKSLNLPKENLFETNFNKNSNIQQKIQNDPAFNIEKYQQGDEREQESLKNNNILGNNYTNNSLYSLHSNDINITNSINELPKTENYLRSNSNLNCSLEKDKASNNIKLMQNNSAFNYNNNENLSQISGINENYNKTNYDFNPNYKMNKSNVKNKIIFPEKLKKTEEEISRREKSFQNKQYQNVNPKSFTRSYMQSEFEIDENDIVLFNEEDLNNSKMNLNNGKEKELFSEQDNHNFNTESLYEDAKTEKESSIVETKNAPVGAYGNHFRIINEDDDESVITENEISIYSSNKYFTMKKNNKLSDINNSYLNNLPKKSEIISPEKSFESSYIVNTNPIGGAYANSNTNIANNNPVFIDTKSQISEIQNVSKTLPNNKANNLKDDYLQKSAFDFNPNENTEKIQLTEEDRSNFFSPSAQTPINLFKGNKQNSDFQNFNLNEEENNYNFNNEESKRNNYNSNINLNTNTNPFMTDIDEFNNNNFKSLLETEHSKVDTTKPQLNIDNDIPEDNNSKLNLSDAKIKETEMSNINPYRRNKPNTKINKENFNKSTVEIVEDRKIKTIFDRINNEDDSKLTKEKINKDQLNNTAANIHINLNESNKPVKDNFNINNASKSFTKNKDLKINEDQLIEIDTSAIKDNKYHNSNIEPHIDNSKIEIEEEILIEEKEIPENKILIKEKEIPFEENNNDQEIKENEIVKESVEFYLIQDEEKVDPNYQIIIKEQDSLKESKAISEFINSAMDQENIQDDTFSKKLEPIKKIEEPENNQNVFEESLLNEDKKEYEFLRNLNQPLIQENEILSKIYGDNFVKDWKQKTCTKIVNHVKSNDDIRYFENNVINHKNFINELPELVTDYEKSLNEFTNEINSKVDKFEGNLFNEEKFDLFESGNFDITEKEKLLYLLNSKPSRTTFNKISYLYISDILDVKYSLNNNSTSNDKGIKDPFKVFKYQKLDDGSKISYWRESLCDGNSFYRMFMFSLMEQFIFKKDFMEMAKLFKKIEKDYKEIGKFNKNFKDENKLVIERIYKNIDIEKVLTIFNEILNSFKKENYIKAYNILINAFNLKDESFDKVNYLFNLDHD